ncbi:flavodoxin [Nocardia salmonicida]
MNYETDRRTILRAAVSTAGLAVLTGCGRSADPAPATPPAAVGPTDPRRILIAYFSRTGENYYNGGRRVLDIGNTEVVAGLLRDRTGADIYRIEALDRYPDNYDAAVARNRSEQDSDARPAIATPLPDLSGYDIVMLGSPVWNSRAPQIMSTFTDGSDFAGTSVMPFVTYAVSGMSGIDDAYRRTLTAARDVTDGLAIRGEQAADSGGDIDTWLRDNALTR